MDNVQESIKRGKVFAEWLRQKRNNASAANIHVKPREVSQDEFKEAIVRFQVATNQLKCCELEDFDTSCMKLVLAEAEINKLFLAAKLYKEKTA